MTYGKLASGLAALALAVAAGLASVGAARAAGPFPDPRVDEPLAARPATATAVVAGGCFWGVEGVFQHVAGVTDVVAGYAGGSERTASYHLVGTGETGHAESVKITYDPSRISYGQLLKVFFAVAHDPTELNRQGPDVGSQYRSAIFAADAGQKKVAEAYLAQLDRAHAFARPIVTRVTPLQGFYPAEAYHQNYLRLHPTQPYIVINDLPKIAALKRDFPKLYVDN